MLDDGDSDGEIERSQKQAPALLRARLNDASEHESRMRSTISSARRFALDLERTGAIALHATPFSALFLPAPDSLRCQC